jgi:integrase
MARPVREVPWLTKRGEVYYAAWYDQEQGETKRLSLRTADGGEAKSRFAAFLREGAFAQPSRAPGLTVTEALDQYLREHASKKCADFTRQEDAAKHLKAFFGDEPLARVDIPQSRAYADARRSGLIGGGKCRIGKYAVGSDSTIRRELNVLRAASNHAKRWKRSTVDIQVELPTETLLSEDVQAPYFTRAEIATMLGSTDGEFHHFLTLAYYTGARRGSIEELTKGQVRLDQRQILLQKPGKVRTKKRQPIVPILPEMEESVQALLAGKTKDDQRLFETRTFYKPFVRLCKEMKIFDRTHPHLLRHSRATHLLQAGVSIYDVAALLGDTPVTVTRVYGHHSHRNLADALTGR